MIKDVNVPSNPIMMTGFLPILSEARPHAIPVKNWLKEKLAAVMPA
jgi:hypothetical protein